MNIYKPKNTTQIKSNCLKLAIIGATGVVGDMILKILESRNLHITEYVFFASKKSAGKTIEFMGKSYTVKELNTDSFDDNFDFAIFCAGGEISSKYIPIAISKGCIVIDNSSHFRMDKNVPLVVPEINAELIQTHKGIISNPNCSTIQAVVALKPLHDRFKIKRLVFSTYQSVSGAGLKGIQDFENGVLNYINNKDINENYYLQKFTHPIFSNCIPQIDVFADSGNTKEEEKLINETRKLLMDNNLKISATCVRVPVINCHSESINIEFENDFKINNIFSILKNSPGIIVQDNIFSGLYPLAINSSRKRYCFCRAYTP